MANISTSHIINQPKLQPISKKNKSRKGRVTIEVLANNELGIQMMPKKFVPIKKKALTTKQLYEKLIKFIEEDHRRRVEIEQKKHDFLTHYMKEFVKSSKNGLLTPMDKPYYEYLFTNMNELLKENKELYTET